MKTMMTMQCRRVRLARSAARCGAVLVSKGRYLTHPISLVLQICIDWAVFVGIAMPAGRVVMGRFYARRGGRLQQFCFFPLFGS